MQRKMLVVLALAVATSVLPASAADARKRPCARAGEKIVLANSQAAVLRRDGRDGARRWTLCHRDSGRRSLLGTRAPGDEVMNGSDDGDIRLSGRFAALISQYSIFARYGHYSQTVVRVDARSGRRVRGQRLRDYGDGRIGFLTLGANGHVVFVKLTTPPNCSTGCIQLTVTSLEPSGVEVPLESGSGFVTGLRVDGDTAVWQRDGAPRSAPLS